METQVRKSALKTISSRLRGIDAASNLPKLSAQMERFGVQIEDGAGGFRNIYDIMQDLSVEFERSSDQFAKQAILESLAGKQICSQLKNISLIQGKPYNYKTILSQAV